MPKELQPEFILRQLEKGQLFAFYLFYGDSEFRLEKVLNNIRETLIPEAERDFNLKVFYADDTGIGPADILDTARSLPFLSQNRLVIVRRTESLPASALKSFIPYLEKPVESTCLIFLSSKPDFRNKFFNKIKELGRAVNFKKLYDKQALAWIIKTAKELGLDMDKEASLYLQQVVGNRLMDLHSELEKLYVRFGKTAITLKHVEELAIFSRMYTIFELMDELSFKRCAESISMLNRYMEEEGKDEGLKILGMLIRQIRILWQTKSIIEKGGHASDVARRIRLPNSLVDKIVRQTSLWSEDDLERGLQLMYQADGLMKTGAQGHLVLENLVVSLCT